MLEDRFIIVAAGERCSKYAEGEAEGAAGPGGGRLQQLPALLGVQPSL